MSLAIRVENLSKAYQLGQIGTGTISRDLERFIAMKIRGKEDPFLKLGQTNDRTKSGDSDIVWSLKDINFDIEQGTAVGIIGRNGAGKSTLLKLLSRITSPTSGQVKIKGRIASLLEVGTGFHAELSGRENIFLNGAILGMRKKEIKRKFDEIVDFAGVERYIDTPVKRYSSGMYVRLAFAVAAHLESEILIVDEVLSVGDAEFQKKCLGKMGEVSKGEGRTVLFVSHNMAAVKNLCSRGIILKNGMLSLDARVEEAVSEYLLHENDIDRTFVDYDSADGYFEGNNVRLLRAEVLTEDSLFSISENTKIRFEYELDTDLEAFNLSLLLYYNEVSPVFNSISDVVQIQKGRYSSTLIIPSHFLNNIQYHVRLFLVNNSKALLDVKNVLNWTATETLKRDFAWHGKFEGNVRPRLNWEFEKIS